MAPLALMASMALSSPTAPAGEAGPMGPWPWASAGVAVIAGASAVAFGVMAQASPRYAPVDPRYTVGRDEARALATASNVAWAVAGAAALSAAILFYFDLTARGVTVAPMAHAESSGVAAVLFATF